MLKLSGAALILVACFGYVNVLLQSMKLHQRALKHAEEFLTILMEELRYEQLPLQECFERTEHKICRAWVSISEKLKAGLEQKTTGDVAALWKEAFRGHPEFDCLTVKEQEILLEVGNSLGFLDVAAQTRQLEFVRSRLEHCRLEQEKEGAEKRKLYRYLGMAAGIFVILILV